MSRYKLSPEESEQNKKENLRKIMKNLDVKSFDGLKDVFKLMVEEILENGLEGELDDELGYTKYDYRNKEDENSRNGYSKKTLKTSFGETEIKVLRDRNGEFEPQLVKKNQTTLTGDIEEKILSMYAKGMITSDIETHIQDIYGLNFSLIATPAEGLSGRFVRLDREKYGTIPGVTDRDYYTNSFHIPVYYGISAFDKIRLEAPYHALTNGGHITYIELDGDPSTNLEAFEKVIRCMKEQGVGYGSVNHPVDRDPVCGYTGIIGDVCPQCGRTAEEHTSQPGFERIRRITGYLVGTLDRFNNGKRAEESDRVKHMSTACDITEEQNTKALCQ